MAHSRQKLRRPKKEEKRRSRDRKWTAKLEVTGLDSGWDELRAEGRAKKRASAPWPTDGGLCPLRLLGDLTPPSGFPPLLSVPLYLSLFFNCHQ